MIRINLLSGTAGAKVHKASVGASEQDKDAAKKIMIALLLPIVLYFYEIYNLGSLNEELSRLNSNNSTVQAELQAKKDQSKEATKLQAELKLIESKIEAIRFLSKTRLRELKAFDTLQTIIPEKLWFSSIKYQNQKLEITGLALDDDDVDVFFDAMKDRPYFSQVNITKIQDKKVDSGVLKEFFLISNVETAE